MLFRSLVYASAWAKRVGLENCQFAEGGVFDRHPYQEGQLFITLNVMRHFVEPMSGYRAVWDSLPQGASWITDFLCGQNRLVDGDFSTIVAEREMRDFLEGKEHSYPFTWMHEVGDWWLTRLEKK